MAWHIFGSAARVTISLLSMCPSLPPVYPSTEQYEHGRWRAVQGSPCHCLTKENRLGKHPSKILE